MRNFFVTLLIIVLAIPLPAQERSNTVRPKVGLVLSGGGALGFAHVGALKIIDSLGIPIDYVAGTSFGGLVGGLYSIGYGSDSLQTIMDIVDWTDLFADQPKRSLLPFAEKKYTGRYHIRLPLKGITPTPPSGVIAGQKISLLLSRLTYNFSEVTHFDSLPIPFRCVGVDLITGNQVVMKNGPLARAMRATMAIPSAFSPVEYGDSLLLDGGLLNNYPVDVVRSMGADIVIGVDVSGYKFSRHDAKELLKVLDRASSIPRYQRMSEFIAKTDIYIEPELEGFTIADFEPRSVEQIADRGYRAALSRMDTLIGLKKYLDSFTMEPDSTVRVPRKPKELYVHGVHIVGNERLDFSFIYSLLNIRPGSRFSPDIVEEKITEAYTLGYFETITYAAQTVSDTSAFIVVTVKEKLFRELNIGLRYDEFHQLVGIFGVRSTNVLLTGIRFESELEFAGLFRTWGKLSYPSRSLDLPIYPFVTIRYKDVPLHLHTPAMVTQLKERTVSIGAGFGLMIDKSLSIESELTDEGTSIVQKTFSGIPKISDHLRHLSLTMSIDQIDNLFVPRSGIAVNARLEFSSKTLGSDFNYTRLIFTSKYYISPDPLHTVMIGGDYYRTYDSPPLYKNHFIGGPEQFIGADYMQINGSKFFVGRTEYRYEYKRDIFLKGMFNVLVDPDILNPVNPAATKTRFGIGAGVMFTSILGPIEIIIARGDRSYVAERGSQRILHFSAGMKF